MMRALDERKEKFQSFYTFKCFMIERARIEHKRYKRKMEPGAFIRKSFFVFVARKADQAFIGKYIYQFNLNF